MTDDQLRDIIHHATHRSLPPANRIGIVERARIQIEIAGFVIGAIRASEHGADSFGSLCLSRDSDGSGEAGETHSGSTVGDSAGPKDIAQGGPDASGN